MAGEIASAYISLLPKLDGKALKNQTGRAGDEAGQSAGKAFGGSFASIATKVIAAAGIFKGVSAAGRMAKTAIFDFNSQLENSSIAFTTMLGSGKKAQTFLDQLQAFAKSTPFEFGGLVKNTQTMMGMGVAAKDVIPFLTGLGDSVASVGGDADTLNNTILAFSQTMAKGTLDMGNMNQLLQGGMPSALKVLAASYGVTTGEMVKMISAGKVQSSEALPKLIKGLEEGTSATAALGGMMDKQSATFSGALGNISDGLTQTTAHAFKPFFDFTTRGLMKFADLLGSPGVDKFADKVNAGLTKALKFVDEKSTAIRKSLSGMLGVNPERIVLGWGQIFTQSLRRVQNVVNAYTVNIRTTLSRNLADAPEGVVLGWGAIFSSGLGKVASVVSGFARQVWTALKPQVIDTYRLAVDSLRKSFDALKPYAEAVFGKLKETWDQLVPILPKLLGGITPIGALLHGLLPVLPVLADAFGRIVQALADALLPILPPLIDAWTTLVHAGLMAAVSAIVPLVRWTAELARVLAPLAPVVVGIWVAFKGYAVAVVAIKAVRSALDTLALRAMYARDAAAGAVTKMGGFKSAGLATGIGAAAVAVGLLGAHFARANDQSLTWRAAVGKLTDETKSFTDALVASNGALDANVRMTVAKQLQDSGLAEKAAKAGISLGQLTDAVTSGSRATAELIQQWQASGDPSGKTIMTTMKLAEAYGVAQKQASDLKGATGGVSSALNATTTSMNSQMTASDALRNALDRLSGKAINAEQAELSLKQAAFALTDQVQQAVKADEAGATALDTKTAAGTRNRQSLLSLIQQANAHAQAVADQTGSVTEATVALQSDTAAIKEAAKNAGLNTQQVEAMIKQYAAVPKDVRTAVTVDIGAALASVTRIKNELGSITGIQIGLHGKGIGANAGGTDDWRGGLTLVGERGPEIVALPPHSSVINNRNADKLGSGMSDAQFDALIGELRALRATTAGVGAEVGGVLTGVSNSASVRSRGARGY